MSEIKIETIQNETSIHCAYLNKLALVLCRNLQERTSITTQIPVLGKKSLPSIKFERIPFSFEQIYMPYKYKSIHKLIVVSMVTKVDVCCHDFPILNLCLPVPTPPRRWPLSDLWLPVDSELLLSLSFWLLSTTRYSRIH